MGWGVNQEKTIRGRVYSTEEEHLGRGGSYGYGQKRAAWRHAESKRMAEQTRRPNVGQQGARAGPRRLALLHACKELGASRLAVRRGTRGGAEGAGQVGSDSGMCWLVCCQAGPAELGLEGLRRKVGGGGGGGGGPPGGQRKQRRTALPHFLPLLPPAQGGSARRNQEKSGFLNTTGSYSSG